MENRDWWTTVDDFEGGWCPCTGVKRKLPNVILNIWHRQSGKSSNLARLAIDYRLKDLSRKICIITSTQSKFIFEKLQRIIEHEMLDELFNDRENEGTITMGHGGNVPQIFSSGNYDLLLLDEFMYFDEKTLNSIVQAWNNGHRKGTIVAWSTPSRGNEDYYNKLLRNVEMINGTRTMINKVRACDTGHNIPVYMRKNDIELEYNLKDEQES